MTNHNDVERSLLRELYDQGIFGSNGLKRLRFRADHIHEVPTIDSLERSGLIRSDSDEYFITLLGVAELDAEVTDYFFDLAERIYQSLALCYHKEPGMAVQVQLLAREVKLGMPKVVSCVTLMAECYLCSAGFSGAHAISNPMQMHIVPAETILAHPTFRSCIEKIQSIRSTQAVEFTVPDIFSTSLFPVSYPQRAPSRLVEAIPDDQAAVLKEVYVAIEHCLLTLASIGLRTVIDMLCLEQVGDIGSFKAKLKALLDAGTISLNQEATLLAVIDAGNASAHRGFTPDADDIAKVLDVVEHLLSAVYLHPKDAAELTKKTPARPLRAKSNS